MVSNPAPNIFLSYAWANTNIADEIDNDFKSIGITFRRDVRDLTYRNSIKEFMQQIGKTDFVLMLISDEYLRSENCMYEVTELLNTHEFEKRILPIVLDNARYIFKAEKRLIYYEHWKTKCKEAEQLKRKHPNQDFIEHVKKYNNIIANLDIFFQKIADLNVSTFENLKKEKYKQVLKVIGFEEEMLLEEIFVISNIIDLEEKELALESFLEKNPDNKYGLFQKAFIANEIGQYKKAKRYYENLLIKHPSFALAHNNLAVILVSQGFDKESARRHFEEAIKISPNDLDTCYNLANLLTHYFADYASAREYYERSIRINPKRTQAYNNLANLLKTHFSDYSGAKHYYEEALKINPQLAEVHNNLALLLKNEFLNYLDAKVHYEDAIRINPLNPTFHFNLANLLTDHFSDFAGAKEHLEMALKLNPGLEEGHNNLANLLVNHFSDNLGAKSHYEDAIKLNPRHVLAHYNLSRLLKIQFSDSDGAKSHYLIAKTLNASLSSQENDDFFGIQR